MKTASYSPTYITGMKRASYIAAAALCAALYAGGIAVTAPIPTPWGVGHLRPAVVVPAFFAIVSGPYVAVLGAALGTFVGSILLASVGLSNPLLSLVSGVPGNFVGFFLLGLLTRRYRSWRTFIWASLVGVFIGNLIAASGVMAYLSMVEPRWAPWPLSVKLATIMGFTLFWMVTMIPFILPIVPALIRAVAPLSGRAGINVPVWKQAEPSKLMPLSLTTAIILGAVFAVVVFTPLGDLMFVKITLPDQSFWVKTLVLIAGVSVAVFGPLISLIRGPS